MPVDLEAFPAFAQFESPLGWLIWMWLLFILSCVAIWDMVGHEYSLVPV
jgi:hypothetical protein